MFSHVFVGSNDLTRAKVFYDAVLGTLGIRPGIHDAARNRLVYPAPTGNFLVTIPIDGNPATVANGGTIGFAAATPAEVDAWHAAGVANGGTAIEDAPGERPGSGLYLAYLRDPDGNKLCALHRLPA